MPKPINTGVYELRRGKLCMMKPDCPCGRGVIQMTYLGKRMCPACYDSQPLNDPRLGAYIGKVMDDLSGKRRLVR